MAIARSEILVGTRPQYEKGVASRAGRLTPKPTYTQSEITKMIISPPPPELEKEGKVETPVGIWHMDGNVVIFDARSSEELSKITVPDPLSERSKNKLRGIRDALKSLILEPSSSLADRTSR